MDRQLFAQLALLFLLTQGTGLFAGSYLIEHGLRTTIINEDPQAIENAGALVIWIIIVTAMLLGLIRLVPEKIVFIILKGMELLAILGSALIVLLPFGLDDIATIALSLAFVASRLAWKDNTLLRNATTIIAAAGAGALIGASLGTFPILVFTLLIAVYDFIAVFKTGHMVVLAKTLAKKNLSFTYAMPTTETRKGKGRAVEKVKGRQFELGTGDMVVPLAFAVSVFGEASKAFPMPYSLAPPIGLLAVSFAGIAFTVHHVSLEKGKALPALPVQALMMAAFFAAIKIAGILP